MISTKQDRKNLNWSLIRYMEFGLALQTRKFVNENGDFVSLKKMKLKKLQNLRHKIKYNPKTKDSPIHIALVHTINHELSIRKKRKRYT